MRYSRIPRDLFIRNRRKLAGRLEKNSVAIVHSNDQMLRNGDQFFPYRQNSDLFYLTGIEQEMTILLLCPDHPSEDRQVMLFIREPDPKLESWEGKKLDKKKAEEISGIANIHWLEKFGSIAREVILESENIYCTSHELVKFRPDYLSRDERYLAELKKEFPLHGMKRLSPILTELRLQKEPEELALIMKAVEITKGGFDRILSTVKPGQKEYEVEAELTCEFTRQGAAGHAYAPIIASGANACILHYINNDQVCQDGELLLSDFGAEYANYAADCTRTIPVNGRFSDRQKDIYDACHRVFKKAKALIIPGTTIDKINEEVGKIWEEEHVRLGLYSTRDIQKQSKEQPLYMRYCLHGVSHFLGLDVHDVGSKQEILKPGMVLTCEPGIYIPAEKTGIRLENDILVTEHGNLDLMEDVAIDYEEIEELMQR
ncbi:MAG: X-Pro aminopeptidase [Bacteroides sp. SM1_62]|nr:MAG: X-Pro aminopeptidase [Bacteroides sp. SM23_62]KPL26517.1 MAG: X-Pro aminopeptidase [Bacteroides sp. SM1_62]